MTRKEKDIQAVKALIHGKNCYVNWCEDLEEGSGEVWNIWGMLFLFYIPEYGKEGQFFDVFKGDQVEKLVDVAHGWN